MNALRLIQQIYTFMLTYTFKDVTLLAVEIFMIGMKLAFQQHNS